MFFLIVIMVFEPGMIPEYLLVKDLGLMNTLTSLILYKAINVYYLFILMRFIQDIPEEILEASRIDGAGHFRLYSRIILPLSKPGLATLGLFYGCITGMNISGRRSIFRPDQMAAAGRAQTVCCP